MEQREDTKLKVLMTGSAGRVGSYFAPSFMERYSLRTFDLLPSPSSPDHVAADLTDADAVRRAMEGRDVLVHLAADPHVDTPFEKILPSNIIGTYNVFQAACDAGVRRIVFASTVHTIMGYPYETTVHADDPPRPDSFYAVSKLFGENLGRYYYDKHGIEFVGVRIGTFVGADEPALRRFRWLRYMWLSRPDALNLFIRAVEAPGVGYAIVAATSETEWEYMSLKEAREVLGYEPKDSVKNLPPLAV